jgi:acyl-CoA synthetase (AMP-forming)/AMP-acid ligase II
MTIGELLSVQADLRPDAVALVDDRAGRTLTFAELADAAGHAAAWWQAQGLRRGQAVLVFVPMSADLYVALLALFRLSAVALFLDPSAGRAHIEQCCSRWPPDALLAISRAHLLRLKSPALRRIPIKAAIGYWIPATKRWPARWQNEAFTENLAEPADPALVTFTSGTTGTPKAALRTHQFLLAQQRALESSIALKPGEVDLATLPVFVLANLAAGVTTVLPDVDLRRPGSVDAAQVFAQIKRRGVTRLTAAPAFMERLVAHRCDAGEVLNTLTKLYTGGGPVFPRLLDRLRQLAPSADVVAVYGSTEAEPIADISFAAMEPDDIQMMREGSGLLAGAPVKEISLRVVQDRWGTPMGDLTASQFAARTMPAGEAGEIVVTGDHVLKGYIGGIGDEETKFRVDGEMWHRTGDAGCLDRNGRVWLLGRCAARISDSRGTIYPLGIESIAMTHPEVRRAAALAHAGKRLLIIEANPDEVLKQRLSKSASFAFVDAVKFVKAIPVDKRHNSKIDYPALRRMLASWLANA